MLLLLIERLLGERPGVGPLVAWPLAVRAALAAAGSLLVCLLLGRATIAWLRAYCPEPIKSASTDVARLHQHKQHTPTMGGLFVIGSLLAAVGLMGTWTNPYLHAVLLATLALTAVGFYDDLIKLCTAARGLSAPAKLLAQTCVALPVAFLIYHARADVAPPTAWTLADLGWAFVPCAALLIVGFSNAVNLTDGLDGLAGGCLVLAGSALALAAYAISSFDADAGEMAIVAAALAGAALGFLWFNRHPASVFMGNTGSLPLGGLLAVIALVARQELLLLIVGGVFVAEALSVIAQVVSFRLRGRRVFLCAPVHHHFQMQGWSESKIVARFWLVAALCGVAGLAALKVHVTDTPEDPQLAATQRLTR